MLPKENKHLPRCKRHTVVINAPTLFIDISCFLMWVCSVSADEVNSKDFCPRFLTFKTFLFNKWANT